VKLRGCALLRVAKLRRQARLLGPQTATICSRCCGCQGAEAVECLAGEVVRGLEGGGRVGVLELRGHGRGGRGECGELGGADALDCGRGGGEGDEGCEEGGWTHFDLE